MDRNWQSPGVAMRPGAYATSSRIRDLEDSWRSTAGTAAPPEPPATTRPPQASGAPAAPSPPAPPRPPHPPVTSVEPTSPGVALPLPGPPSTPRRRSLVPAPWRMRGPEARRQLLLVGGFVVLAILAAVVVAASLSAGSGPEAASRVPAGPGGPNPFARTDEPVPALTENDSVLPQADAALLPADPDAVATTTIPAEVGKPVYSTPAPASGLSGAGSTGPSAPAPVPPKSVTLVYSATQSGITINGNASPKLNVGDTLVLKRASGEAGTVAVAPPPSFSESQNGYDYSFKVTEAGAFNVLIQSFGNQQLVPVTVG